MSEKRSKRVLVIDDEQAIVDELVAFLDGHGYETTVSMSAEEALDTARSREFDLIISDINLGAASGLELCQQIHDLEIANETPVIFLSGAQIPDIIRRSHSAGGAYYVRKPFDPEVMVELIDKAMWMPALTRSHIRKTSEQLEAAMV